MPLLSIPFSIDVAGVPTDAAVPPILSDAGGSFGIRENESGVIVLAAGPAMTRVSAGRYTYPFADAEYFVAYEFAITYRVGGGPPQVLTDSITLTPESAAGYYADQNDIVDLIDTRNLQLWSNLSGEDLSIDVQRVQRALTFADGEIDRELRELGVWRVPLVGMDTLTTRTMEDMAARLAAWWLYQNRGITEVSDDEERPKGIAGIVNNYRKLALDELRHIRFAPQSITATRLIATQARKLGIFSSNTASGIARTSIIIPP